MRLSEAGMLGAALFPSAYGAFATALGRCFLGSAVPEVGVGASTREFIEAFEAKWPWLRDALYDYPCCACNGRDDAPVVITHLFDRHVSSGEWTREQLADWIRQIEPPEPSEAVAEGVPIGTAVTTHP